MSLFKAAKLKYAILACATATIAPMASARCDDCDDCQPRVAIKTNLLHDVALTPDLGIELSLAKRWSVSAEGVWAWWSNDSRNRYWRIYGGWCEMRYWTGEKSCHRALTGLHVGLYGSMLSYDFEFGHKGWQSPGWTYGVGVSYGYSLPVSPRLNIDFSIRAGYSGGNLVKYHPQCGQYTCTGGGFHRYFGITGLEVTLVWFPGSGKRNNPDYDL